VHSSDWSCKVVLKLDEVFFIFVICQEIAMVHASCFDDGHICLVACLDGSGVTSARSGGFCEWSPNRSCQEDWHPCGGCTGGARGCTRGAISGSGSLRRGHALCTVTFKL
jgi:hypothetical protein